MLRSSVLSRGLCTASAEAPAVMFGTAGRYANALYAVAAKKNELSQVSDDLTLLKETLSVSPSLAAFCSDPSLGRALKAKGIVDVLTSAKATDTTKNAMATLAENGRLGMVRKVIDMYSELLTASKGEVSAVITSAEPLPQEEIAKITKELTGFLGAGQSKISLTTKVDPSLISGVTVEFGDKFLDYSVATQLKKLQGLLKDGF